MRIFEARFADQRLYLIILYYVPIVSPLHHHHTPVVVDFDDPNYPVKLVVIGCMVAKSCTSWDETTKHNQLWENREMFPIYQVVQDCATTVSLVYPRIIQNPLNLLKRKPTFAKDPLAPWPPERLDSASRSCGTSGSAAMSWDIMRYGYGTYIYIYVSYTYMHHIHNQGHPLKKMEK